MFCVPLENLPVQVFTEFSGQLPATTSDPLVAISVQLKCMTVIFVDVTNTRNWGDFEGPLIYEAFIGQSQRVKWPNLECLMGFITIHFVMD